jgi:predicted dehydrogenase
MYKEHKKYRRVFGIIKTSETEKEGVAMNRKACIIGGETHLSEITGCIGKGIDLVAVSVNEDIYNKHFKQYGIPNYRNADAMPENHALDLAGIANENDLKFETVQKCMTRGMDVVVDKPLCITRNEQAEIEKTVSRLKKDIIMLLTLRGNPSYMAVKECMDKKMIGEPVHCHIRMSVQLKKEQRPPWFLDVNRSGGMFLDLLIHGIDALEWMTGLKIQSILARTGNIGYENEVNLRNHASMYCELSNGGTAVIEGQRMLPQTKGSDYRVMIAGTQGVLDMDMAAGTVFCTNQESVGMKVPLPERMSVVETWLKGSPIVNTEHSLRANRIAVIATESAITGKKIVIDDSF